MKRDCHIETTAFLYLLHHSHHALKTSTMSLKTTLPTSFLVLAVAIVSAAAAPRALGEDGGGKRGGTPVPSDEQSVAHCRIAPCVQRRYEADIDSIGKAIDNAPLADPSVRNALRSDWTEAAAALRAVHVHYDATFRALLPFNDAHARLFQVQAALWKAQGQAALTYSVPATWDPTELVALPHVGGQIEVHTMRGEYRAAAVNLANASDKPIEVRVYFDGLPGSPTPNYVTVHEVPWTDTVPGTPVAAALTPAQCDGVHWHLTVLPGMVRQLWLTFNVRNVPPGDYAGNLMVESSQGEPLRVPVRLRVYPMDFPKQLTLQVGGWDYTNGVGNFGVTPQNRDPLVAHLREYLVNGPWATGDVLMQCSFAADGTVKLDTQMMDEWLARWPNARMYNVFNACDQWKEFGGATMGTPEANRNVASWISAWVRHLGEKGIPPEQLTVALQDEPKEGSNVEVCMAFAKAIRAAEPKVHIWVDPVYDDPAKAPAGFLDVFDILCPNRTQWLKHDESFGQFYREQQRQGRTLHLYSCSGPARLLDPYSYYRLQAWHCWHIGATGSFFWAFGDNSGESSWNEYMTVAGPYPFAPSYLDQTSVTPGKQMEAIRESAEDYEYFVMLRDAVAKAKAAGRSDSALAPAELLLATATDEVLSAPGASEPNWHTAKERSKADAVRVRILEALLALQGQ